MNRPARSTVLRVGATLATVTAIATPFALSAPAASAAGTTTTTTPTTWYVSGTGSDSNSGISTTAALRTVSAVLAVARSGDTVSVLAGTYSPFTVNTPGVTITAARGATVLGTAAARDNVLVNASNVRISGLDVKSCVPNPAPGAGIDNGASAGVRVAPGISNVTLTGLTVHDSHATTPEGLPYGCHGIEVQNASNVSITNSTLSGNADGVMITGSTSVSVSNNSIRNNDVLYKNTLASGNDAGGFGVTVNGSSAVTIASNEISNNGGPSHDYTLLGGAVSIWQSSTVAISGNTMANNLTLLVTGAGGTNDCAGNSFTNNVASGRTAGSAFPTANGLRLGCATRMTVSGNTLSNFDWWTFWIYQKASSGTINGLNVNRNVVSQGLDQIYALGALPSTDPIAINTNRYTFSGAFGTLPTGAQVRTLAAWQSATGFDNTVMVLQARVAGPATWYVSPTGNDSSDGKTNSTAFRTIGQALKGALPQDTIVLLGGTWSPVTITTPGITLTGQNGASIVGAAGSRDNVFVNADNVTVKNLDVRGCVPDPATATGMATAASAGVRVGSGVTGVVLDHLTIHDSHGVNKDGLPFGCYGVQLVSATRITVSNSDIYHNAVGISVTGGGQGDVLTNNTVHDQDVTMTNTVAATTDDWGAVGIAFTNANGASATRNTVNNNFGPDHDFGVDGGAFEIFQSSNITMSNNTMANNTNVLETGAGGTNDCSNNAFTGNSASGRTTGSTLKIAAGLILRCAKNMTVSGNQISNVDWWTFWIYQRNADGSNGGSVSGLSLTGNNVTQGLDQIYAMGNQPTNPGMTINSNKYTFKGAFGTLPNGTQVRTKAAWTSATGFDTVAMA